MLSISAFSGSKNMNTENIHLYLVFKFRQKEAIQKANDQAQTEAKKQVKHKIHWKYIGSENIKAFSSHMGICKTRNECYKF